MKYLLVVLLFLGGCNSPKEIHDYNEGNDFNLDCVMKKGKNGHVYRKDGKWYGVCNDKDMQPEDVMFNS